MRPPTIEKILWCVPWLSSRATSAPMQDHPDLRPDGHRDLSVTGGTLSAGTAHHIVSSGWIWSLVVTGLTRTLCGSFRDTALLGRTES